jgi:Phage tail assembly chaperone
MKKKSLLTIAPKAEFTASVPIPCPDREPEMVEFTFLYRSREQLSEWVQTLEASAEVDDPLKADMDMVLGAATGWELADEFNAENVRELLNKHPGSAISIYQQYVTASRAGKQKN